MMPDSFVQSPAFFELAVLEVEKATVLAALPVFQCHCYSRTRCPSAALSNKIKAVCSLFSTGKFTHVDVPVLFQPCPSSALTGASAIFMPTAACMTKRSWAVSVNTTPLGPTAAAVRGTTRGERGVLAHTCPYPRAPQISVSTRTLEHKHTSDVLAN